MKYEIRLNRQNSREVNARTRTFASRDNSTGVDRGGGSPPPNGRAKFFFG